MSGFFGSKSKASSASPAVGALNIQQSSYGTPVALVYGTSRLTGNLIWYDDFKAIQVSTGGGSGAGKGGAGGGSYDWNYYTSFMVGLCEGPISAVGRVWEDKAVTNVSNLGGTVALGTSGQSAWGYLSTYHPDKALSYSKLAHVDFANYALGTSTSTPNLAFEVFATPDGSTPSGQDAWPSNIITDFLSRSAWPTSYLDTLSGSSFDNYTKSMGLAISPCLTQQDTAANILKSWTDTLNSEFVWTGGVLKIIPYGDVATSGNGATYTPNMTPIYDLSDDDFILEGDEDPITVDRTDLADAYNQQPIEFFNLNNSYNVETYTAEDAGHIDMFGVRTAPTLSAHHITSPDIAQMIASAVLWRQLYVRTQYKFKLGWKHILIEPMDYVTLTEAKLEFNRLLVRVTDIEEDENGMLTITAEEVPGNLAQAAIYATSAPVRYSPSYSVVPASINTPVFFEPTLELLQSTNIAIWLAVSCADPNWGGCNVFISTDDLTFSYLDRITSKARQGVLTASLANVTTSPDLTHTLAIDLSESLGTINGAPTQQDATNLNTLSLVDGELIAFGSSTLTGANKYNLSYLVRGAYGTGINPHAVGATFTRLDNAIYKYVYDQTRIGKNVYFKFQSFNIYGAGEQDLSVIPSYTYMISGSALAEALDNPSNLCVSYSDEIAQLNWTGINDIRTPIWYEVRKGAQFVSAQVVATTKETSMSVYGSDTYWVTALYYTSSGQSVYSAVPASISVTTPSLSQFLIQTNNEAPSWSGTFSGNAAKSGSTAILTTGNSTGIYTAPTAHRIALAAVMSPKIIINWTLNAVSTTSDVTSIADMTSVADITGIVPSGLVSGIPQIRLSQDGGTTWGAWQNWTPGKYQANLIDYRMLLSSVSTTAIPVLAAFSITVDVPQLTQNGTATTLTTGLMTVSYATKFNALPVVAPTIMNPVAGDLIVMGTQTTSGFQFAVMNGGAYVARTVNWNATSY